VKKLLSAVKYLVLASYVVAGLLLVVFALPSTGWKALTVLTGSMRPTITPGSLVFVHRVPNRSLRVGDVITYINPRNTAQTITHRITETREDHGLPAFVTQGDANPVADPQILGGNVVGRVVWHVPYLGTVVGWTKSPLGLVLLLGLPALLIIIDEVRLLVRRLSEAPKPPVAGDVAEGPAESTPTNSPLPAAPSAPRRGMDGIMRAVMVITLVTAGFALAGGQQDWATTLARLRSNNVRLVGNRLSVLPATRHMLLEQIWFQAPRQGCMEHEGSIELGDTGPGSFNQAVIHSDCHETEDNNNSSVVVTNSNSQVAHSGNASASGNTNGGSANSGSASNNNSTTTVVSIGGGSGSGSGSAGQAVVLYNPTAATVNLKSWQLADASGTSYKFLLNTLVPSHGFLVVTAQVGNGLAPGGDRLVLRNPAGLAVDAASWGTDTTQLNPSVATQVSTKRIERLYLSGDSDTAADWLVVP
jgi:signal peptidase I